MQGSPHLWIPETVHRRVAPRVHLKLCPSCSKSIKSAQVAMKKEYENHPKLMPLRSASSTPSKTTPTSASSMKNATRTQRLPNTCPGKAVRQERSPAAWGICRPVRTSFLNHYQIGFFPGVLEIILENYDSVLKIRLKCSLLLFSNPNRSQRLFDRKYTYARSQRQI